MRPPFESDTFDPEHKQAVDSRAYAFAYLIREPSQVPADFTVDCDFECALFLPRESVPRFEIPRYVPRLLLLWPDRLTVRSHPSCGLADTTEANRGWSFTLLIGSAMPTHLRQP